MVLPRENGVDKGGAFIRRLRVRAPVAQVLHLTNIDFGHMLKQQIQLRRIKSRRTVLRRGWMRRTGLT